MSPHGKLGISISSPNHFLREGITDHLEYARWIEALGFDMITLGEHVLVTGEVVRRGIKTWYRPDVIWPDALVLLGALATVTSRVRLATSIFIAPFRPAAVMAKMAATVDCLSRGRLTLGVGSGWLRPAKTRPAGNLMRKLKYRPRPDTAESCRWYPRSPINRPAKSWWRAASRPD